jgi:hypothetical protein
MENTQKKVTGVTIHLDPVGDGRVRLVFALDGNIQVDETITQAQLRDRLPSLGFRAMGYLFQRGKSSSPLGQIMDILS